MRRPVERLNHRNHWPIPIRRQARLVNVLGKIGQRQPRHRIPIHHRDVRNVTVPLSLIATVQNQSRRLACPGPLHRGMRLLHLPGRHSMHVWLIDQIPRPQRRMSVKPAHPRAHLRCVKLRPRMRPRRRQYTQPISLSRIQKIPSGRAGHQVKPGRCDTRKIRGATDRINPDRIIRLRDHPAAGQTKRKQTQHNQTKCLAKLKTSIHRRRFKAKPLGQATAKRKRKSTKTVAHRT